MIKDDINNVNLYSRHDVSNFSPLLIRGLNYLKETDFTKLENGRYEVVGNDIYAIVQDYYSKPESEGKFEVHRKYIDIQYIISGEEKMGYANFNEFIEEIPYDKERDIAFLIPKYNLTKEFIEVKENEFVIFMPDDAHMPSIAVNEPSKVKKVVVKVLY